MKISVLVLAVFLNAALCVTGAVGATWHVEKDGSGDYSVIQDAVDICASGDTIIVGPGWFEEYKPYSSRDGDYFAYVQKRGPSLTIIGSGSEETFIGSSIEATWGPYDSCRGIAGTATGNGGELRLENLTIGGVTTGIDLSLGSLEISHCVVSDCHVGIKSNCTTNVSGCEFLRIGNYGLKIIQCSGSIFIADSYFSGCGGGFNIWACYDVMIQNCEFRNGSMGGVFYFASGEMKNCTLVDDMDYGISFRGATEFQFHDNMVSCSKMAMMVSDSANSLLCENNVFSGTSLRCINICGCQPVFHNNDITFETGYSVYLDCFSEGVEYIDMTNNYWGTDDPDSLAAWIWDANDDNSHPMHGYVDFSPFSGESVPTEETTWGDLKAMFR